MNGVRELVYHSGLTRKAVCVKTARKVCRGDGDNSTVLLCSADNIEIYERVSFGIIS